MCGGAEWHRTLDQPPLWRSGRACSVQQAVARGAVEAAMGEINLQQALNDPADVFETPDAVIRHPGLTREQKVQILNNWQLDASRLEGSEGEGMMGGEGAPMLHRVRMALA